MMTTRCGYRAYGMSIASEFKIPGAVPSRQALCDAEITISAGSAAIDATEFTNGPYSRSGSSLLFDAAGVARYLARSPNQLVIERYPGADPVRVCELISATALPMLMWMRGGIVLHAAGVVLPHTQSAIAIAGPSGIGKSTIANRLLQQGARIVGDDTLWLTLVDGEPIVRGIAGSLHVADRGDGARLEFEIPQHSRVDAARLAGIFILRPSSKMEPAEPARLRAASAVEAFLQNRHRPKIPAILGRNAELFSQSILHCRALPIYELPVTSGDIARSLQYITALAADKIGVS